MSLHMVNLLLEHGQHGGMLRGVSTGLCGDSWRYTMVFVCDWCVTIVIVNYYCISSSYNYALLCFSILRCRTQATVASIVHELLESNCSNFVF